MTYAVYMLPRVLRRSQEKLTERLMILQLKLKEKADAEEAAEKLNSTAITETGEKDNPEAGPSASINHEMTITTATASPVTTTNDEPKKDL